jgi:hypothetical protein
MSQLNIYRQDESFLNVKSTHEFIYESILLKV